MREIPPKNVYIRCEKKDACTDAKHKVSVTWNCNPHSSKGIFLNLYIVYNHVICLLHTDTLRHVFSSCIAEIHTPILLNYRSTKNFLTPIPVSDWLIFCCRDLILHQ